MPAPPWLKTGAWVTIPLRNHGQSLLKAVRQNFQTSVAAVCIRPLPRPGNRPVDRRLVVHFQDFPTCGLATQHPYISDNQILHTVASPRASLEIHRLQVLLRAIADLNSSADAVSEGRDRRGIKG